MLGLIILFSTAVLWGPYETVISKYQWLAKAGLALVDVIATGLACWHLYAKYAPLKVWCYLADAALAVVMVVHADAVLQLDSSSAQQLTKVKAAAAAQGTVEAARIKVAAEAAAAVKQQTGSSALANRTLRTAESGKQDGALTKLAASVKPATFLSEEYLQGGVYYWLALLALFLSLWPSGFPLSPCRLKTPTATTCPITWNAGHWPRSRRALSGRRSRTGKIYWGRIGKRQLAAWQDLPAAEFQQAVCEWVEQKRAEKL